MGGNEELVEDAIAEQVDPTRKVKRPKLMTDFLNAGKFITKDLDEKFKEKFTCPEFKITDTECIRTYKDQAEKDKYETPLYDID